MYPRYGEELFQGTHTRLALMRASGIAHKLINNKTIYCFNLASYLVIQRLLGFTYLSKSSKTDRNEASHAVRTEAKGKRKQGGVD
jgi:hypothetical protein